MCLNISFFSFSIFLYEKVILSYKSSQSDGVTRQKSKWIKFWVVPSELKWLWLLTGNRYLQGGSLGEVSGLTVEVRVEGTVKTVLKEGGMKKWDGETKRK